MSLRSDARIAPTGKNVDIAGLKHPTNRDVVDAQDLIRTMHTNHTRSDPVSSEFATVDDAAAAFGLDAERTRVVKNLIGQVVRDVRGMVLVAKSAREAGLPREVVPEIIRRGVRLRERLNKSQALSFIMKGKPLPAGSERKWGSHTYVKGSDGKWKKKGKDGGGADGKPGDKPKGKDGKSDGDEKPKDDKPKKGKKGGDKHKGGKSDSESDDSGGKPSKGGDSAPDKGDSDSDGEESVDQRFERLKAEADKLGIKVTGKLKDHHDHKHLDRLEDRIKRKASKMQGDSTPEEEGANPADVAPGRPEGHDKPQQAHEIHRLQQEVHDLRAQLAQVRARLDSPHQQGMYRQLDQESKEIAKDPSPQALSWLADRIKAFVILVAGKMSDAGGGVPGSDEDEGKYTGPKDKGPAGWDDSGGDDKAPPKKGKKGKKPPKAKGKKKGKAKDDKYTGPKDKGPAGWDDTDYGKSRLFLDSRGRIVVLSNRIEKSRMRGKGGPAMAPIVTEEDEKLLGRIWESVHSVSKAGGPYIGPRGGKWADPKHTIPWKEDVSTDSSRGQIDLEISDETRQLISSRFPGATISDFLDIAGIRRLGAVDVTIESENYDSRHSAGGSTTFNVVAWPRGAGRKGGELAWSQVNHYRDSSMGSTKVERIRKQMTLRTIDLPADRQKKGIGLRMAGDIIKSASKLGLSHIRTYAEGNKKDPKYIGYYVWPLLGFNTDLTNPEKKKLRVAGFDPVPKDTNDLMSTQKGRDWYKDNGRARMCLFDMSDGSKSRQVFSAYYNEKKTKAKPKKTPPKPAVKKKPKTRTTGGNRSVNEHGHKHDLKPGDHLTTRSRHGSDVVTIHSDGKFEHKGEIHHGTHSLLNAVHGVGGEDGPKRHGTTFGRYFGLTKQERTTKKAIRDLKPLLKSKHVVVRQDHDTDEIELLGDLEKAGIPAHMMPFPGAPRTVIDADAAVDLISYLGSSDE